MSSQGGYKVILSSLPVGLVTGRIFSPARKQLASYLRSNGVKGRADNELVAGIAGLPIEIRKSIIYDMQHKFGFSYPNAKYMPVLTEVEGYDLKDIEVAGGTLANKRLTEFGVDFPYNSHYTFVGSQFLRVVTSVPEIANPSAVPQGWVVRYDYTKKPGIRLLNKIDAMSDISVFDSYNQVDVLKYENDSLTDNVYEIWNQMIGNDLGVDAELYNALSQTTQVYRIKDGYQTGKATQEPLDIYIPLLFSHNRSSLRSHSTAFAH